MSNKITSEEMENKKEEFNNGFNDYFLEHTSAWSMRKIIWSWISTNFVPKEEVEKAKKEGREEVVAELGNIYDNRYKKGLLDDFIKKLGDLRFKRITR